MYPMDMDEGLVQLHIMKFSPHLYMHFWSVIVAKKKKKKSL